MYRERERDLTHTSPTILSRRRRRRDHGLDVTVPPSFPHLPVNRRPRKAYVYMSIYIYTHMFIESEI